MKEEEDWSVDVIWRGSMVWFLTLFALNIYSPSGENEISTLNKWPTSGTSTQTH